MKQILLSVFAIGLAGIAAVAATSLFLSTPVRIAPATDAVSTTQAPTSGRPGSAPLAVDAPTPAAGAPQAPAGETGAKPPAGQAATPGAAGDTAEEEGPDKDPYEGIAPEELPPDLQYNADSSVSFPTNI